MSKLRIYTASKLRHSTRWKELMLDWQEFDFTARWPTDHVGNIPDSDTFARWFWQEDFEDVARCDVLVLYAEEGDHLRGGLVEAGIAIALHKTVVVVGSHGDYGTWQWHPSVQRVRDFDELRLTLNLYAEKGIGHFRT